MYRRKGREKRVEEQRGGGGDVEGVRERRMGSIKY